MPIDEVVRSLDGDEQAGLTSAEADRRLGDWGPNAIAEPAPVSFLARLFRQFTDPVVLLLLVAIGVSAAVWLAEGADGLPLDAIVIALIVVLNAVFGLL
ncbi:MAG: cation-transporting P-type ATPase [Acidimicrobiales bacterium]